jgi:type I pantothenate kinase
VDEHSTVSTWSPYRSFDRAAWQRLRLNTPMTLGEQDLDRLRGLSDNLDLDEIRDVYLPLSRLLNLCAGATGGLQQAVSTFLGGGTRRTPFVIGIAGGVAVGKSTTARILRELLACWPEHPTVELVTTDGFLRPNAELERRGILQRKGFPESYDQRALLRFLEEVKAGRPEVAAPVYSHLRYDIVPDALQTIRSPDILIVEGLNVLQPASPRASRRSALAVSDFFDFAIYVDARPEDVRRWYVERFLALRETAFSDPTSYFHGYAGLSDEEAVARAERIYTDINEVNLVRNVLPTRGRARLILHKGADHTVQQVLLREV